LNATPQSRSAARRNPIFTTKDTKSTKKKRFGLFFSILRVLRDLRGEKLCYKCVLLRICTAKEKGKNGSQTYAHPLVIRLPVLISSSRLCAFALNSAGVTAA
jgi:hypothetical protein